MLNNSIKGFNSNLNLDSSYIVKRNFNGVVHMALKKTIQYVGVILDMRIIIYAFYDFFPITVSSWCMMFDVDDSQRRHSSQM